MSTRSMGALIGWKRASLKDGTLVTMQLATSEEAVVNRDFDVTQIIVDDSRLCSLVRDLTRAAQERGIEIDKSSCRFFAR